LSSILAMASGRDRLQPLDPTPIRINVMTAPAGLIANRPTRSHVLYRASSALWDADERNLGLPT
jgi:hypothetical protein